MSIGRIAYTASVTSLTGLIALTLIWELWIAPLRPGGSWLVLKALPLLAPLFGILREQVYTYRWAAMLVVAYFVEGVMRAYADAGWSATLAGAEIALALTFILAAAAFVRSTQGSR